MVGDKELFLCPTLFKVLTHVLSISICQGSDFLFTFYLINWTQTWTDVEMNQNITRPAAKHYKDIRSSGVGIARCWRIENLDKQLPIQSRWACHQTIKTT